MNIKKRLIETVFQTSELSLVANLVSLNFKLHGIDRSDPRKINFIFLRDPNLENSIKSFWDDTALVNPKTYFNALRELKSRIYEGGQR